MVEVRLYVEGGGAKSELQDELRRAFKEFLRKAGCARQPKIIAGGSREATFKRFRNALSEGVCALILVDSEGPVAAGFAPWAHLNKQDGWSKPSTATDDDCHLMVECMENWLLGDSQAVSDVFGKGCHVKGFATLSNIETISKGAAETHLKTAAPGTPHLTYKKGAHSFEILACLDPAQVTSKSLWAKRLVAELKTRL